MCAWKSGAAAEALKRRAGLLGQVREFFKCRGVLEVETPIISRFPTLDLHLESFSLRTGFDHSLSYLITSPEYHMKRLLCTGIGSIYQIGKAFRREESGSLHNPEFTIIEWYRDGWDHWQLMEEVELLLDDLLNCGLADRTSYGETFDRCLGISPSDVTLDHFKRICSDKKMSPPDSLTKADVSTDEWLDYLMGIVIAPGLGLEKPVFIYDYPASQANLARIHPDNSDIALRFELYFKGMELGNGFFELKDPDQQKSRFINENTLRKKAGKPELPIDDRLMAALKNGLPDCAGVAMGFDRIVMLALNKKSIDDVIGFSWDRC